MLWLRSRTSAAGPAGLGRQRHVADVGRPPPPCWPGAWAWPRRGPRSRPSAGTRPQWLVSRAADAIAAGELDATLIVGAEAQHSAKAGADRGVAAAPRRRRPGSATTSVRTRWSATTASGSAPPSAEVGLVAPVHVYALFESVIAHRAGRSAAEQRGCWARSWRRSPRWPPPSRAAWFPTVRTPVGARHGHARQPPRRRALPETAVRHLEREPGRGRPRVAPWPRHAPPASRRRAVFCWSGADATDVWFPTARPDLGSSAGLRAAADAALHAAGVGVDDIDAFDFYSCFPCAVEMAVRGPRDRTRRRPGPHRHRRPSLFRWARQQLLPARRGHHGRAPAPARRDGPRERHGLVRHQARRGCLRRVAPDPRLAPGRDHRRRSASIDAGAAPVATEAQGPAVVVAATAVIGPDGRCRQPR